MNTVWSLQLQLNYLFIYYLPAYCRQDNQEGMISNAAISRVLRQIAYLIELEEGSQYNSNNNNKNKPNIVFKIRAYRRTADIIENLSSNVEEIYNKWKLKGLN